MEPRITLVTLGVTGLERSLHVYRDGLGWHPSSDPSWPIDADGSIRLPE